VLFRCTAYWSDYGDDSANKNRANFDMWVHRDHFILCCGAELPSILKRRRADGTQ